MNGRVFQNIVGAHFLHQAIDTQSHWLSPKIGKRFHRAVPNRDRNHFRPAQYKE